MNFLKTFVEAKAVIGTLTEEEFNILSRRNNTCDCGQHVWRYIDTGMCFTCTTGEADSSNDYDIGEEYETPTST